MEPDSKKDRLKRVVFLATPILLTFVVSLVILELIARRQLNPRYEGNANYVQEDVLGWLPASGNTTTTTSEFKITASVNSLGMNDREVGDTATSRLRIMALGDSHTFACGVSQNQAWPKVLEEMLFKGDRSAGAVYNCAVVGYNAGQYLLRMRQLADRLRPKIVIIGFSMATDVYDLAPPSHGGFVYGADYGRVYFDLDAHGSLIEHRELVGRSLSQGSPEKIPLVLRIRRILSESGLYKRIRRSEAAMWLAIHFQPKGQSFWPGLDTALKKKLDGEDAYRWRLLEEILKRLALEAREKDMKVVLVNIPYLAQVYDTVWKASFGAVPEKYDRWIGGKRLEEICKKAGIYYLDATQGFVEEARRRNTWFHYRIDSHPTAEGQRIIAQVVAAGLKKNKLLE